MPPAVIGGLALLTSKVIAAKTLAIGFAVAFKTFATGAFITFASSKLMEEFAKKPSRPNTSSADSGVAGSTRGLTGSVIPKRWVVGRARVSGGLVAFRENDREMKAVMVISAGSIDSIERVFAHGDEVEMQRGTGDMSNVLTPVSGSKYYGIREVSYEEEYSVEEPSGGDGDGGGGAPVDRPSPPTTQPLGPSPGSPDFQRPAPPTDLSPGGPGFEGSTPSCGACRSGGGPGPGGSCAPSGFRISDGSWTGDIASYGRGGIVDLSPWALARYNESVSGTQSTAGAFAGDGVSGQQGEGGGETFEERQQRIERERAAARSGTSRVRRTRTRTREESVPLIKITEFFSGDGSDGQAVADILGPAGEGELEWTAQHAGNDVSYIVLELFQPDYSDIEDRFWPGIPQMEFIVRGLKIRTPIADPTMPNGRGETEPTWTRNAAAIRYWYLTQRRNIDSSLIDLDSYTAASLLCDDDLQLTEQSGYHSQYPESVKRYTIDGSITSGDSAAQLDAQFDFAWQGFVVESSGMLHFRPGADMESRFTITEDDVLGEPVVSPFGARSDLSNEVSVSIEQSSGMLLDSDGMRTLPPAYKAENFVVVDALAQRTDGERLPQELSQLKFVTEPVQVVNLLTQRLRQQRGLTGLSLHVKSPNDWRYHTLLAGDKIEVVLPEHGIGVDDARLRYFRVLGVQVNDDYSVNLNLLEWPDGLFTDRFDFPTRQRKFSYALRAIPAPVGRAVIDWQIDQSTGLAFWQVKLSWDSTPHRTYIRVDSPGTNTISKDTLENDVTFILTEAGIYTFTMHHREVSGLLSPQSQVVLEASAAGVPLPRPVVIDAVQNANIITFTLRNAPNRDIIGLDVRYRSAALDASFADIDVIMEDGWETAPQMNVSPVVPPSVGNVFHADAVLPVSATYRIYVRFVNRIGNLSPISNVIDARFEIPASATGSISEQPDWAGEFNNALVWAADGENRVFSDRADLLSDVTIDQWDGLENFPFGQHTGFGKSAFDSDSTSYTTRAYDFTADGGSAARREVYVVIEPVSPAGKTASDPAGFEITLMYKQGSSTAAMQSRVVADGVGATIDNLAWVQAAVSFYNQRNHALTAVTIGWRDIE